MKPITIALLLWAATLRAQQTPPTVWEPMPTQGSVGGGDVILFRITNEPYCDPTACSFTIAFDGIPAATTNLEFGYLRAITPPHPSGNVEVTLSEKGTLIARSGYTFRYAGQGEIGAPDTFNYEAAIVPLAVGSENPVEGAFGSRWTTELWISNSGDSDVEVFTGYPGCGTAACRGTRFPVVPAHSAKLVALPSDVSSAGYIFYVQKGGAEHVHFSLRARDISRTTENAGTELPVVRTESVWQNGTSVATLLNVPVEETSRTSLRLYANSLPSLHVRLFDMKSGAAAAETDLTVGPADGKPYAETHGFPARSLYAQIDDIRTVFPQLPEGRYRIEVTSPTGGWVWALSTVTNNSTQLITAIASQQEQPFGILRW